MSSLEQARTQLGELIEAARKGMIIPIRLTGQLETLGELLTKIEEEQQVAAKAAAANVMSGDVQEVMLENADFLKVAVHELRTPMTSIRGYADMLSNPSMGGQLTDMQNQLLTVIRTNARRMEGLLTDVSYINKLRSETLRVNAKMDMFKNIAMLAEKNMRAVAQELNRHLELDIPQGLPMLTTDGELLAHALGKLVENGLRYSPEGEGKVTIAGRGEGSKLVITVADNGVGMTPDELNQLGKMYYRSDNDVVRAYKGSGLGIPIAYGIVQLLGGVISVESMPGEGTRFTITLQGMT